MPEAGRGGAAVAGRIVLGTVQLGQPYGRLRRGSLMPEEAAEAILDRAWLLGVRTFDTADGYGEAAPRLSAWLERRGHEGAEVVTKVKPGGGNLRERVVAALARFETAERRVALSHGPADTGTWDTLRRTAAEAGAAAGQSVYEPAEVRAAVALPGTAVVQAPGNVFDRRALDARGALPARLDLRSVFMQGVLLESPDAAEARAPGTAVLAAAVAAAAAEIGAPAGALLIAATLVRCRPGDRLVLGADTPEQLDVIPLAFALPAGTVRRFAEQVAVGAPNAAVPDPRTW